MIVANKAPQKAKKTKKQRKHGRNKVFCNAYKLTHRRERNKIVRLKKHLIRFPADLVAKKAHDHYKIILGQ